MSEFAHEAKLDLISKLTVAERPPVTGNGVSVATAPTRILRRLGHNKTRSRSQAITDRKGSPCNAVRLRFGPGDSNDTVRRKWIAGLRAKRRDNHCDFKPLYHGSSPVGTLNRRRLAGHKLVARRVQRRVRDERPHLARGPPPQSLCRHLHNVLGATLMVQVPQAARVLDRRRHRIIAIVVLNVLKYGILPSIRQRSPAPDKDPGASDKDPGASDNDPGASSNDL